MRSLFVQKLVAAALLIGLGMAIPMTFPKFAIPPVSFTLASHVAIFLAMIISPPVAVAVSLFTTWGFFLAGLDITIVARAASHLVFVLAGSLYLRQYPRTLESPVRARVFSLIIGVIHGGCEALAIAPFFFSGGLSAGFYESGFVRSVLLLVGAGALVHSMVDFEISLAVARALGKQRSFTTLFGRAGAVGKAHTGG